MSTNFSRSLSFLRQERGISQRQASQELGISQALLSHYENGIREPGFPFLLRACDYYTVSADFLLGRTLARDGTVILDTASLRVPLEEGESNGEKAALISKRLLGGSLDLLFRLLAETKSEVIVRAAAQNLSTALYTLFRHLYQVEGTNSQDIFSVPKQKFSLSVAKIETIATEMDYVEALLAHQKERGSFPDISHEALSQEHGTQYQSLLHVVHSTGERINLQTQARDKAKREHQH